MTKMSWDDYYAGFYDWSPSTQKSYSYRLSDFGDAEEVFEVASEFAFDDEKFASRFIEKAIDHGVRFTPDRVMEMLLCIDKPALTKMAEHSSAPFSREQVEEMYMLIDDDAFERISQKQKTDIFLDEPEDDDFPQPQPQPQKPGLFTALFAFLGMLFGSGSGEQSGGNNGDSGVMRGHNGRCNGDCANCPPHYGYRYGRWYYGHCHNYGCEFGGNRGDGGMD